MKKKEKAKGNILTNWWKERKISALKSEISALEAEKKKVTEEKTSFESFLGNLSNVSKSLFDLSNNLGIVHNTATKGISDKKITPKLGEIEKHSATTKTCIDNVDSLIEKVNQKISELNESLNQLEKSLSIARANLAELGG